MQPEQPAQPEAEAAGSYTAGRMAKAGIPAEANAVRCFDPTSSDSHRTLTRSVLYDSEDGMAILYVRPNGECYTYETGTKNQPQRLYTRTRLKEPRQDDDGKGGTRETKYLSPRGSRNNPFFPPQIIEKARQQQPIEVLFMVEGEMKAFAACCRGMDAIGLPSNRPVFEDGSNRELHGDIRYLLDVCKVERLVLLHDADALTVKWERDKDLAHRPRTFLAAVKSYRDACQPLLDAEKLKGVFYMHLDRKFLAQDAKGLDDLLETHPDHTAQILEDALRLDTSRTYFKGRNLTSGNQDALSDYFGLSKKEPEQHFYKTYNLDIGQREFVFRGLRYEVSDDKPMFVAHEDTAKFMRIGSDWYKFVYLPASNGGIEEVYVPYKVGEIVRDYAKKPGNFIDDCPKFDGFCIKPNFNGAYQRVVELKGSRLYNMYSPLSWEPKPGHFDTIQRFLKHIFGGKGTLDENITGDPFTVAIDWLTLLLQHPTQMLPVIVLVSRENGTGKSTFLDLLTWIFGTNACILNNEQFKMKFNGHYATKFIIGLDESFQDLEKKAEKERLKQMVTSKDIYVENKGVNVQKIPFYAKLVMCSNEAERIMKIEEGESRWFVVKVPVVPEGTKDPMMGEKMQKEIPALLSYLFQRPIHHPREDRLWFKPEHFLTDQFKAIVEATKNRLDRLVEETLREKFMAHRVRTLRADMKTLVEEINAQSKFKVDQTDVKIYLQERRRMEPNATTQRFSWPVGFDEGQQRPGNEDGTIYKKGQGRYYTFEHTDWLSTQELENFGKGLDEPDPVEVKAKAPF